MRGRTPGTVVMVACAVVLGAGAAGAQDAGVDVQDNSFAPDTVTVTPGDTVTWTQSGSNPHSVTADDGSFDSSENCPPVCMRNGDSFEHTFDEAGEFGYHCKIHGSPGQGMSGTVVVEAAGEPGDDQPDSNDGSGGDGGSNGGSGREGRDRDRGDEPAGGAVPAGDDEPATSAGGGVAAEGDSQALPHTGGPALLSLAGLVLVVGGAWVFRRRHPG